MRRNLRDQNAYHHTFYEYTLYGSDQNVKQPPILCAVLAGNCINFPTVHFTIYLMITNYCVFEQADMLNLIRPLCVCVCVYVLPCA